MPIKFFVPADENAGGAEQAETENNQTKFPEDPGLEKHRIPDGGGSANGFINEDGHNSGKGFWGHVETNENEEK